MLYNLAEYIAENSDIPVQVNGFHKGGGNTSASITQYDGFTGSTFDRSEYRVQVMVRSCDKVQGKRDADELYDLLHRKYKVELPEVTVAGIYYPEVDVDQMTANQIPGYLDVDANGRHLFVFNLTIITL